MAGGHYLERLFKELELNAKQFAESIGLNRADKIYHVLNGRNGVSSDLANKIRTRYPNVRYEWLIGEGGAMLQEKSRTTDNNEQKNSYFEGTKPQGEETLIIKDMEKNLLELLKGQQSQMERAFSQMDTVLAQQGELISIVKNLTSDSGKPSEVESEKKPSAGLLAQEKRGELTSKK